MFWCSLYVNISIFVLLFLKGFYTVIWYQLYDLIQISCIQLYGFTNSDQILIIFKEIYLKHRLEFARLHQSWLGSNGIEWMTHRLQISRCILVSCSRHLFFACVLFLSWDCCQCMINSTERAKLFEFRCLNTQIFFVKKVLKRFASHLILIKFPFVK